jgi:hypothetical protein
VLHEMGMEKGDTEGKDFIGDIFWGQVPMVEMHRRAMALADRFGVPWRESAEAPDPMLTFHDAIDRTLDRMARAGLIEFAYAMDEDGRAEWKFTQLFEALDDPNFVEFGAGCRYRLIVVDVDDPVRRDGVLSRGMSLARAAGVVWKGLAL